MLKEEIKQNDTKYSKPEKSEKWRRKKKSKNRCHEQKTISNMVDTNQIISAVTLNVKSLTAPVKSQRFPGWIKKSKIQ